MRSRSRYVRPTELPRASGGVNITKNGWFENHRTILQKRRWLWRPPA
jgi:hypothetical protein